MLPGLTLVLGGAASGKSAFAEALVTRSGRGRVYLATAQAFDDEMRAKIDRHQRMRGEGWRTLEAPLDLGRALATISGDQAVLLDCATMWLSNQMLAENDLSQAEAELMAGLALCSAPVVMTIAASARSAVSGAGRPDHIAAAPISAASPAGKRPAKG